MYLDLVLEARPENEEFRMKFRQHILRSQKVQFSYLLSRLESSSTGKNLHHEKAILYGKVCTCIIKMAAARWTATQFHITMYFSDDGT